MLAHVETTSASIDNDNIDDEHDNENIKKKYHEKEIKRKLHQNCII